MYDLSTKITISRNRIIEWCEYWKGQVYVSFSGGKDSTVLLRLVRGIYPDVPAVFCNTGLEFPEVVEFVKSIKNVIVLRPKMDFKSVIEKYGYPIISKEVSQKIYEIRTTKSPKLLKIRMEGKDNRYKSGKLPNKWRFLIDSPFKISPKCCDALKKRPFKLFEKESGLKPFIGIMAHNSHLRKQSILRYGCNAFKLKRPQSRPLGLWTDDDIWKYIHRYHISYSNIYKMGYAYTGCIFCCFGIQIEEYSRFKRLKETHPKLYKYCMEKLQIRKVLNYIKKGGK